MALSFVSKKKSPDTDHGGSEEKKASPKSESKSGTGSTVTFMRRGAAAKQMLETEEQAAELRKAEAGKMFRFYVKTNEEASITFLDGKLDEDGMLDIQMFYEHRIQVNGGWTNFVCTAEADQTQPCPICEKGDRPSLVGVMTVIDHTEHKIKNGPNAGKMIKNTRKLFVAKRQTITQLTTLAKKRGGLVGCQFDVTRIGDTAAAVGSQFDFQTKYATRMDIMEKFDLTEENVMPADYAAEITYYAPQELIDLGVGKSQAGVGYSNGKGSKASLNDEL